MNVKSLTIKDRELLSAMGGLDHVAEKRDLELIRRAGDLQDTIDWESGDGEHSLSVVLEAFLRTGRPGNLHDIVDRCRAWQSLEIAAGIHPESKTGETLQLYGRASFEAGMLTVLKGLGADITKLPEDWWFTDDPDWPRTMRKLISKPKGRTKADVN